MNNLEFRMACATGLVTLGGDNTYSGTTILSRGVVEITKMADASTASSFGTGNTVSIITMGDATTSAVGSNAIATIRYLGSTDSTTNRVLNLTNSDVAAEITAVSARARKQRHRLIVVHRSVYRRGHQHRGPRLQPHRNQHGRE